MHDENSENPLKYCFVIDNNKIWITDAYYSERSTHRKNGTLKGSLIRLQQLKVFRALGLQLY